MTVVTPWTFDGRGAPGPRRAGRRSGCAGRRSPGRRRRPVASMTIGRVLVDLAPTATMRPSRIADVGDAARRAGAVDDGAALDELVEHGGLRPSDRGSRHLHGSSISGWRPPPRQGQARAGTASLTSAARARRSRRRLRSSMRRTTGAISASAPWGRTLTESVTWHVRSVSGSTRRSPGVGALGGLPGQTPAWLDGVDEPLVDVGAAAGRISSCVVVPGSAGPGGEGSMTRTPVRHWGRGGRRRGRPTPGRRGRR